MGAPGRPTLVTATAVIASGPTKLFSAVIGVAAAGQTIKLHDCAAAVDAAAGNEKARLATDAVESFDFGNNGAYFAVGLVAVVSGGSPVATVVAG